MNNTEEMAVQTFSIVPEAYQQVFIENGADFPDDLVNAIKEDPQKAAKILEGDKQLKRAVVQIFKSNKEVILQAVQQAQNPVSVEKNGGVLLKMQPGGKNDYKINYHSVNEDTKYETQVKAPGDTLRIKAYPYSTVEMQTYPNGNVRYTKITRSSIDNYWSPNSKPSFWQRLWYGTKTVPKSQAQNWEQIIRNHPEDPRNILKHQEGGENVLSQAASAWGSKPKQLPNMVQTTLNQPASSLNKSANYLNNLNAATDKLRKVSGI